MKRDECLSNYLPGLQLTLAAIMLGGMMLAGSWTAEARQGYAARYDALYLEQADTQIRQQLQRFYRQWRGVPYEFGGTDIHGVDCSGFVYRLFGDVYGLQVPRTTRELARLPYRVELNHLIAGDVLIFGRGNRNLHVGVYVANGEFIHASKSKGVVKSTLANPYWASRYAKAVRIQSSY
ncbi:MAG: NlpC/P60 family protein [Mariprofundaceae bacterium]